MTMRLGEWTDQSRRALGAALDDLRARIEARAAGATRPGPADVADDDSALVRIVRKFHLSAFERDVLLLAAGVELDSRIADLVSQSSADGPRSHPTVTQVLAWLDDGHWSALTPDGVLRRARLIKLQDAHGLAGAPIVIEEPVLHALTGIAGLDERLRPYVWRPDAGVLVPSHERAAARMAEAWTHRAAQTRPAKVLMASADRQAAVDVFGAACRQLGASPFVIDLAALPVDRAQLEDLLSLWERDAVLHDFALFVDADDAAGGERQALLARLLHRLTGFVAVSGARVPVSERRSAVSLTLEEITPSEQAAVWQAALGPRAPALEGHLGRLTEQFRLPARAIVEVATALRASDAAPAELGPQAWEFCRRQARGGLDDLAQRLEPRADWDRLVLPAAQVELLRSIATQTRHRFQVYERWGFRTQSSRGFGVSALFHGPSGVGKTFAAEVLANELALDLYRIDLSATVSKYIGETEKNLRRIFDAAEQSGAILLFDEADALFGKRSEVTDSHDRYANLEVSYLLQRMEAYRGLAILTTNIKSAVDHAFLRRLRFLVAFPFPSALEREAIWRHAFPREVPLDPALDWTKLARLAVAGGNIANIALDAAFRAARDRTSVGMLHLLAAARTECAKIEKSMTDVETRGWV